MSGKKTSKNVDEKIRMRFRDQILGEYASEDFSTRSRNNHIMTRLSDDIVEIIDALVELGIFKSRSEAVAAYIETSILSKADVYQKLREQAKQIGAMREEAMEVAFDIFQDTDEWNNSQALLVLSDKIDADWKLCFLPIQSLHYK